MGRTMASRSVRKLRAVPKVDVIDDSQEAYAKAWTANAKSEYLQCRSFGHLWTKGTDTLHVIDRGHFGRQLECGRCHMVRIDILARGEYGAVYRRYIPPAGYSMDKDTSEGSTRIPRYLIHEAQIDRSTQRKAGKDIREVFAAWVR